MYFHFCWLYFGQNWRRTGRELVGKWCGTSGEWPLWAHGTHGSGTWVHERLGTHGTMGPGLMGPMGPWGPMGPCDPWASGDPWAMGLWIFWINSQCSAANLKSCSKGEGTSGGGKLSGPIRGHWVHRAILDIVPTINNVEGDSWNP